MFRAFSYLKMGSESIRLTSERVPDEQTAQLILVALMEKTGTGGDIEQHVGGIGWVLVSESETVAITARHHASDREVLDAAREVFGGNWTPPK